MSFATLEEAVVVWEWLLPIFFALREAWIYGGTSVKCH